MKKIYNFKEIEESLYKEWEEKNYFDILQNKKNKNFCIMMPPPNITGDLHMGHAFQHVIMDTIIRYQRMLGKNTLWQVGVDHAGIATQIVVENYITKKENKNFDKKKLIQHIWKWKEKSQNRIFYQMRRLGNSVYWKNTRFTMDDGFSYAVKKVFIDLYNQNLIYRSKKLVNWDLKLKTAISDLEVTNKEVEGFTWFIKYFFDNKNIKYKGKNYITVATTRPETLLGDTAIAVHPKDTRYTNFIGKYVIVPIVNRKIPIIQDEYVDIKKGTGCVKITPGHDFNDYQVGLRNQLIIINFLNHDGNKIRKKLKIYKIYKNKFFTCTNENNTLPQEFQKLDYCKVREKIINILKKFNFLKNTKKSKINVPYNIRNNTTIEPLLTNQWFLKTHKISLIAIKSVKNGDIQFIPKKYENIYFSWMKNIQDWCISRQLWWGHKIPAWYDQNNKIYVGKNEQEIRSKYNLSIKKIFLKQKNDVLDTWFSSALWTFTSLGWPNDKKLLKIFHPTDVLISGFDIIFFWIARMIMMTMHIIKNNNSTPQIPFKKIYITGLFKDEEGKKMSKSQGNVLDPVDLIDGISLNELLKKRTNSLIKPSLIKKIETKTKKEFPNGIPAYGTDALRLTLLSLSSYGGRDIIWSMNRLAGYRNFCNKLWNASRFIFMNIKENNVKYNCSNLSLLSKWIIFKFNNLIKLWKKSLNNYRFDISVKLLYEFTWNEFCNWYLEISKTIFNNGTKMQKSEIQYVLLKILEALLKLAHPIIPFITETIWKKIKTFKEIKHETIMLQDFPKYKKIEINNLEIQKIFLLKKFIFSIREIRLKINITLPFPLEIYLLNINNDKYECINNYFFYFQKLINIKKIKKENNYNNRNIYFYIKKLDNDTKIAIPISNIIDKKQYVINLKNKIKKIENKINVIDKKLKNKKFLLHAKQHLIVQYQEKIKSYKNENKKIKKQINLIIIYINQKN